jgi:hypothetical protein
MSAVSIFVDLQGFIFNNNFTVKEAAVLRAGKTLSYYVFREPVPWHLLTKSEKSQACWLKLHHHGFQWEDGYVSYNQARDFITKTIGTELPLIYVKGLEKKKWLCKILEDDDLRIKTIDADYEDIARLKDLNVIGTLRCGYHTKHCAMQIVCNLYK